MPPTAAAAAAPPAPRSVPKTSTPIALTTQFDSSKTLFQASLGPDAPAAPLTPVSPAADGAAPAPPAAAPTPTAAAIAAAVAEATLRASRISDYTMRKSLGQGTFGKVRLGQHQQTHDLVAIKIIDKANIVTPKQRNSVQREVRLMKILQHPHIVRVHTVLEDAARIHMVMAYASRGELFDYIVQCGRIPEPEARRMFRQIVSAIDYCHRNSVIHRDLKPENVLLDDDLNVKIIDFGFGNTFHRERVLDTFCGSPFYAAPEMIRGVCYTGPEVDLWSMGVILFAMLCGHLPFDAPVMGDLYNCISKGQYTTPAHVSPGAADLIRRFLTVQPRERITMPQVLAHPWLS
ncbi:hypothetical protein CXG81DRAFT_15462, partial [Caulochytrium protostelioides]